MKRLTALLLLLATFACATDSPAEPVSIVPKTELVLATEGTTDYRIVYDEKEAVEAVRLAADQLARYLEEISGAAFPIEPGDPSEWTADQALIVLGENEFTRRHGLDDLPGEAFALKTVGNSLLIAGGDSPGNPLGIRYESRAGTLIAVFQLLREQFDAEWFLPGERWAVIPETKTLALPRLDERHEPVFPLRGLRQSEIWQMPRQNGIRSKATRAYMLWARAQGAGTELQGEPGHTTQRVMRPWTKADGTFTGDPEWLALIDGERRPPHAVGKRGWYGTWHGVKPALTHPEVVDIHIRFAREFADEHPKTDILPMGLSDGHGYDESPSATALDKPGTDQISDRIFTFYGKLADGVAETHPDRKIGTFAYQRYREPPSAEILIPDNLYVVYVRNNTVFLDDATRGETLDEIREWGERTDNLAFFSYPLSMGFFGLPAFHTEFIPEVFDTLRETESTGLRDVDTQSPHATLPDAFLYARLASDPSLDAEALVADFFERLYGPAAPAMRAYYAAVQAAHNRVRNEVEMATGEFDGVQGMGERVPAIFAPIRDEAVAHLESALAEANAAGVSPIVAERIEITRRQWDLVDMFLRAAELGPRSDGSQGKPDPEALAELRQLREGFHRFLREHGNTDVVPVRAIANLFWTRESFAKWLGITRSLNTDYLRPYEERVEAYDAMLVTYQRPEAVLAAETILTFPAEWRFRKDPEDAGRPGPGPDHFAHAARAEDPEWEPIRIDRPWTRQGHDYHGAAWYRVEFEAPASPDPEDPTWLLFHAVDGDFEVWLNGRRIGARDEPLRQVWDQPRTVPTQGHLRPGQTNRIVVRVEKDRAAAGIWKPVELRVLPNQDAP